MRHGEILVSGRLGRKTWAKSPDVNGEALPLDELKPAGTGPATARLRVLFVLVVLAHHRRRVVHFNVTEHPTAHWTAQQIVDTLPDDSAPAYLLRDRDQVYGQPFRHRVKGLGIEEVLTAPHSPWQNPFAERLIGDRKSTRLNSSH